MVKVLVFDSNIVFSKRVKNVFKKFVPNAQVDVAHNVPLLNYRLKHVSYDLILADVLTAQESTKAREALESVNGNRTYVALWGSLNRDGFSKKPTINKDLEGIIKTHLVNVSGAYNV